jgi:hypothetical protein
MQVKYMLRSMILLLGFTPVLKLTAQVNPTKVTQSDTSIVEQLKDDLSDNIPVVSLDENDAQDGSAQNVSSMLTAGRDPFFNAASFKFGAARFRIRGYDADQFGTYMNGSPMENLDNGFTPYGLWGGLNDVLRNRDNSMGLKATPYAFGDLGGLNNLDTRASYQRAQTSINYAISNRNYANRLMFTHSTGLNKKGWAYSFSVSRRWADEGFTDGTYYDGWSFYAAADKRLNAKNLFSIVAFATPTENGRQGASVAEMRDLSGTNYYNPYWGYQNGVKRNASVARSFQPFAILSHEWKPNDKTTLLSSASLTHGDRSTTGLDWYNAADPRPDYYRYLPSYQEDPNIRSQVYNAMKNNINLRQINWDALYNANYNSYEHVQDANGIAGNVVSGKRAHYIVEERVINTTRYNLGTTLNTAFGDHILFTAGANIQGQTNRYFKRVDDLLGADFYVDVNQFAERDFPTNEGAGQNDLNAPNRILHVGDKFGYRYNINIFKASAWAQAVIKFKQADFFIAVENAYTSFFREGMVKNGLFPNNSLGKSKKYSFNNPSIKGGVTYKIDGRNYIFANGAYMTRAPFFENAFIAPRTRDFTQENLSSEKITNAEVGYVMNAPKLKIRATGYYTQFKNQLNVLTFYSDEYRNFVNYALENIGKEHLGAEFGVEAKLYKGLSINAAAALGDYRYNTRQLATVTVDNSAELVNKDVTIYTQNYFVPTPQEAFTLGLDYRSPKFWFVNVNVNYFDRMFLDFNPIRRTESAVNGVEQGSALWHDILDQTRLDAQYTVDVFAGYSWLMSKKYKSLKKNTYLVFNLGINNLLNNENIVSGGFEQLRFDVGEKDTNRFPDKRFYAYGLNYFASIGLRF